MLLIHFSLQVHVPYIQNKTKNLLLGWGGSIVNVVMALQVKDLSLTSRSKDIMPSVVQLSPAVGRERKRVLMALCTISLAQVLKAAMGALVIVGAAVVNAGAKVDHFQ